MVGRLGWRQPTQPAYAILTEPNTLSKSGRYFEDYHAAVTIQNVKECIPNASISADDFNTVLIERQKAAILKTLNAVFTTPDILESLQTFERENDTVDKLIENKGKFVGWKIEIAPSVEYATALSSVALYFNQACTFNLYCFVDTKRTPIWQKAVSPEADELTIVDVDDLVLSFMSEKTRTRTFYIGYFQDDLGTAQAYDEDVLQYFNGCLWHAEEVNITPENGGISKNYNADSLTYGLNLQFTSYRDWTTLILASPQQFDEAVGLQHAADIVELLLNNPRSGTTQRLAAEQLGDLYTSLNQAVATDERPYSPGLKARWEKEIKKLQKAFFGQPKIQSHSLPYVVYQAKSDWHR